jgi:hypothetical protein
MVDRFDNIGKIATAIAAVIGLVVLVIGLFREDTPVIVEIHPKTGDAAQDTSAQAGVVQAGTLATSGLSPASTSAPSAPSVPATGQDETAMTLSTATVPAALPEPEPEPEQRLDKTDAPGLPDVPVPVAAASDTAPRIDESWTPENKLRVYDNRAATVCPDAQRLVLSVAKSGTRADTGIYLVAPKRSGRIEVGESFSLSDTCALTLDRTGKTSNYFAEISYTGEITE